MGIIYDKAKSLSTVSAPTAIAPTGSLYERAKLISTKIKEPEIPEIPKAVKLYPSTMEVLADLQIDPLSLKADPTKFLSVAGQNIKDTFVNEAEAAAQFIASFTSKERPISEKIGAGLKLLGTSAGVAFSPITTLFQTAKTIPVLGSISKLFEVPIVALGETGSNIANKLVDELPINEQSKENIREGMKEIGALAFQLGGLKVEAKIQEIIKTKTPELIKRFGEKDAQTIIEKSQEITKMADMPVSETLKREPTPIDISKVPLTMKMGELREVAIIKGFEVPEFGKEVIEPKPKGKYIEVPREQLPVKPIEGMEFEMEKGVSALEARMKGIFETQNVEKAKIEAEARGLDISVYDKMNKAEQLRMSAKYVEETPQYEVLEVLEGKREAPKGLLNNAIMLALEEKSLRDKNVNLAIKLASLRSTRMGQEISILTEVGGLSPVSGMNEIIRVRRGMAEKKLKFGEKLETKKSEAVKEIKTEQTKFQMKMSEVSKLLESITCK